MGFRAQGFSVKGSGFRGLGFSFPSVLADGKD